MTATAGKMTHVAAKDWYEVLGLPRTTPTDVIAQAVEKRSRQASALANTAPERSHQLREQTRAIKADLLSGDAARAAYDAGLTAQPAPDPGPPAPTGGQVVPPPGFAAGPPSPAPSWGTTAPGPPPGPPPGPQPTSPTWGGPPAPAPAPRPRSTNRFKTFLQSGYTCPGCGEGHEPGAKFCTACRAQLQPNVTYTPVSAPVTNPHACVYCGTVALSNHRFCRNCGAGRTLLGG